MIGMNMTGQVQLTKSEVLYFEKMTDNYRDELSKSQNDCVWIISIISHSLLVLQRNKKSFLIHLLAKY